MCFTTVVFAFSPLSHTTCPFIGPSSAHSSLSFPVQANPLYEHCTPAGSVGVANPNFVNSPCNDSLSDLNMDHFQTSVLPTTDEVVESPTTPTTPQGFDHTPLLSKHGITGNPCSIPAIQVEVEQANFSSSPSSSLKNDNITRTSISPRSRPKSLDSKHHLTGVNPTRPHSNRLQPLPGQQSCLKDIGPAQASPARSRHAQKYVDQLTASLTPNSRRRYTPANAKEMHMNTSGVKGSGSSPEQLGMKRLHSDTRETIELEYRKRKEDTYEDALACIEEVMQSLQ